MLSNPAPVCDVTVTGVLAGFDAVIEQLRGLDFAALSNRDRLVVLQRLEVGARTIPAVGHTLINQMQEQWIYKELGDANLNEVLAMGLRIAPGEAAGRIRVAADLGPRTAMNGEVLAPAFPETAVAQLAGAIGSAHVKVIRDFVRHLPAAVDVGTREQAQAQLAGQARLLRPDALGKAADRLSAYLNPDGVLDESDRARKRSWHLGPQGSDKMSKGTFVVDPETRAYMEAVFSKLAKPGVCNPDDSESVVDGDPSEQAAKRDSRTSGQRQHDAVKATFRAMLASGELGTHRGLPVTVVATTTVKELTDAAGVATTGTGSLLPMPDLVRMASHANHYLALFDDDGRPIYLGRSKRIASADQRIMLYAKDKGCTFPGCWKPAAMCQCHHCKEWAAKHGLTNVDEMTLVCDAHHSLIGLGQTDWQTVIAGLGTRYPGRTLWIPPKHLDPNQKPQINHYHHPGEYLLDDCADLDGEPRKPLVS